MTSVLLDDDDDPLLDGANPQPARVAAAAPPAARPMNPLRDRFAVTPGSLSVRTGGSLWSSFDSGVGHAVDEALLENEEYRDGGHQGDHGHGQHPAVTGAARLVDERVQSQWDGVAAVVGQVHQLPQEIVERPDEGEHRGGDQCR